MTRRLQTLIGALMLVLLAAQAPAQATYSQQYGLSQDSTFQQQVMVAMLRTAISVLAEASNTTGHVTRAQFAARVIQDPTKWQPIIAFVIAAQNNNAMTPLTTPSTVADSLVQTAMDAQWTNMSGSFVQQP